MKLCPEADALVTIGGALEWDVDHGLRHLQSCADCRDRMQLLQSVHTAFAPEETLDEVTIARLEAAVQGAAHAEHAATQRTRRRVHVVEVLLAAVAAPVALLSSGIPIGSNAAVLATAAMGAAFVAFGSRVRLQG
jgi:hypothetical protein